MLQSRLSFLSVYSPVLSQIRNLSNYLGRIPYGQNLSIVAFLFSIHVLTVSFQIELGAFTS